MDTLNFPYAALSLVERFDALRLLAHNANASWQDVERRPRAQRQGLYDLALPRLSEQDALALLHAFSLVDCPERGERPVSADFYRALIEYHPALEAEVMARRPDLLLPGIRDPQAAYRRARIKALCAGVQ